MTDIVPEVIAERVRALAARPDADEYAAAVLRTIGIDPTGDRDDVTAAIATYLACRVDVEHFHRDEQEVAQHGPSNEARLYVAEFVTAATGLLEEVGDA